VRDFPFFLAAPLQLSSLARCRCACFSLSPLATRAHLLWIFSPQAAELTSPSVVFSPGSGNQGRSVRNPSGFFIFPISLCRFDFAWLFWSKLLGLFRCYFFFPKSLSCRDGQPVEVMPRSQFLRSHPFTSFIFKRYFQFKSLCVIPIFSVIVGCWHFISLTPLVWQLFSLRRSLRLLKIAEFLPSPLEALSPRVSILFFSAKSVFR